MMDLIDRQPEERTDERTETHACDCIDRQAAIAAFDCTDELIIGGSANAQNVTNYINKVIGKIKALPSAQSKNEERMEKSAQYVPNDDFISRKGAIDALMEDFKRIPTNAIRAKTVIEQLPSAHPEQRWIPCGKCIHADGRHRRCKILDRSINEDYFCYWAERI